MQRGGSAQVNAAPNRHSSLDAGDEQTGGRFTVTDLTPAPGFGAGASPAATGGKSGGGARGVPSGGVNMGDAPQDATATGEPRAFLRLANQQAFGKLEDHLREYVRSIPFRAAPTYVPPGARPPEQTRPSKFNPQWDNEFERDTTRQEVLIHSASFRYCTQRLAMGFHAPYEEKRRVIEYRDFTRVLSVPNPSNYEALNPQVVDLPEGHVYDHETNTATAVAQGGPGAGGIAGSKFLVSRVNAAKRKGVALTMSKVDVTKELARMDAEDAADKDRDEDDVVRQRMQENEARKAAERQRALEEEEARRNRAQVVNMYDLSDWRQATGRCLVTTMDSWKSQKTSYF